MAKFLSHRQVSALIKAVGHKRTVLVEGEAGSGKTSMHHAMAKDPAFRGFYMPKPIDCTQLSDGSVWMPDIDRSRGVSRELPNERFGVNDENHKGVEGARPAVICLDEIGKTRQFIKDVLAPIVYERRVGNYELPEGSIVFGCTNLTDEGLGDHMQAHLRNRLIIVQMRKPTKDEWVQDFAVPNAVNETVIAAVEMYPMCFDSFLDYRQGGKHQSKKQATDNAYISDPGNAGQGQVVTGRSLHTASDIVDARAGYDDETLQAALGGAVGDQFAANIMSMIRFGDQLPAYDRVVNDPAGAPLPSNPTAQIVQVFQFIKQVKDKEEAEAVSEYTNRTRAEMKSLFVNSVANAKGRLQDFALSATFNRMLAENRAFLGS
ncbi:hypothetical protein UFOVP228_32 [uncultured Caudovirales phage]|uniref:AAA domain containing protein n=1 Tax=uncultured Caudovirales phage TaxID=2100421 RepID=A0A6J5TAC7_9CAUD|nr:hypothetical protein UFOVP47_70 [uncultured Caudovirales phage]CAB5219155.1 hypothetical protein UFOVP228_32 [uncultured Caudovirales phage]